MVIMRKIITELHFLPLFPPPPPDITFQTILIKQKIRLQKPIGPH